MPVIKYNGLKKAGGARKRRRRTSVSTRARYAPKTARVNRSLIKSNASMIRKIAKSLPPQVYCDWQRTIAFQSAISTDSQPTSVQLASVITDFSKWSNVLRISQSVADAAATQVLRFTMDIRYTLLNQDFAQISLFIVTMRKDHANRDPTVSALQSGSDFIYGGPLSLQWPTLNSAVFKVHYRRFVTLTKNTLFLPANPEDPAGDPFSTYRKGQVTIRPNIRVRSPAINKWKDLPYAQLPYYQRYFALCFITANNSAAIAENTQARVDINCMCTTRNSA